MKDFIYPSFKANLGGTCGLPIGETDRVFFRIFREPADPRNSFTRGSLVEFTGIPTALQALFAAEL